MSTDRPLPEFLTLWERADLLNISERLWRDLQENNLGGYSNGNRPYHILHVLKEVIERYGRRDVGLTWSTDDVEAAVATDEERRSREDEQCP